MFRLNHIYIALLFGLLLIPGAASAQTQATGTAASNLNLRAGPGAHHPNIGVIGAGSSLTLQGQAETGAWLLITTGDSRGWVAGQHVTLDAGVVVANLPASTEQMPAQDYALIDQLLAAPVVPTMTGRARSIYAAGQALGNNPNRFSVVGDCQSVNPFFLTNFDTGNYTLGEYSHLQSTIDHFSGSWGRNSASVNGGFTIASVVDPLWAGGGCAAGESPQACEYRQWQPAFVIVSLEMWRGSTAADYEYFLRDVLDFWIDKGVVPIVGTKSNNTEQDWTVNLAIVRVAREYNVPLWNVLGATHPLTDHGLTDGFHLTVGPDDFSNPAALEKGWTQRNLTALQALHSVRTGAGAS